MELSKYLGWDRPSASLMLRAFHCRNYRLYFAGQGLSLLGTWVQHTAMSWLVYRLTGSAFLLGVMVFSGQIPSLLLAPLAGVFADRLQRRNLLLATQCLAMLQAVAMAFLFFSGTMAVWHIMALTIFLGLVNAFDIPARHSFVVDIIDHREEMGNAIALNSAMFHGARLIGPAVAGFMIGAFGEGICFLLNGVSFLAVIAALVAMRFTPRQPKAKGGTLLGELGDGVRYAFTYPPIRSILLLVGVISLVGMPYMVLLPVFAKDILAGGPQTLGLLMASSGVGAFIGTLFLASRRDANGLGRVIYVSAFLFAGGLAAFSLARTVWLSLPCLFIAGFGIVAQVASGNTILQTIVDEGKRGRIMSLFNMAFMGMSPFGSLMAGALAGRIGVSRTLMVCAALCLASTLALASRLRLPEERAAAPGELPGSTP